MIDIPVGKALAAVEFPGTGTDKCLCCSFSDWCEDNNTVFPCNTKNRKDGKSVVFWLVDYPAKEKEK